MDFLCCGRADFGYAARRVVFLVRPITRRFGMHTAIPVFDGFGQQHPQITLVTPAGAALHGGTH